MAKKVKRTAKKKTKVASFGNFYHQGEMTEMHCEIAKYTLNQGGLVYTQFGKPEPPPCGPGGC